MLSKKEIADYELTLIFLDTRKRTVDHFKALGLLEQSNFEIADRLHGYQSK